MLEKKQSSSTPHTLPLLLWCPRRTSPHRCFYFPICHSAISTPASVLASFGRVLTAPLSFCSQTFPLTPPATHSSESRSLSSLFLSLKQPKECMLSRTSGSMSSAEGRLRMVTFLGTGCSGSGSFFPPLEIGKKKKKSRHQ